MQARSTTDRTVASMQVENDGTTTFEVVRDGRVVISLRVAQEAENIRPEGSVTVTITKHPGNLIIEG